MKCVPKWYLRLDFTFKSSKVAIFFGQISEISFQSHLIFIIQSFRNFEAGYIWKFICYEVRFGSVKITGPVRFGKSGICLVRSTTGRKSPMIAYVKSKICFDCSKSYIQKTRAKSTEGVPPKSPRRHGDIAVLVQSDLTVLTFTDL